MSDAAVTRRAPRPSIGIMQGRLSPGARTGVQAFPWKTWEQEFQRARALGFDAIEWLVTAERLPDNPISDANGRAGIRQIVAETGVRVSSVCADCFISSPFLRVASAERDKSISVLMDLIGQARAVGATTVLVPVLESARIQAQQDRDELIACLREPLAYARAINVRLALEADLPAPELLDLLEKFNHEYARLYYDTGNAAASGYDIAADVRRLAPYISGIHVKDRTLDGRNVRLGRGVAALPALFAALQDVGYRDSLVLETAVDPDPTEEARANVAFVRHHLAGAAAG